MEQLEKKFNQDMHKIYTSAKNDFKYNASRFIQLVSEKGGVLAAKQLIMKDGGTYGFEILWENKRLDLSIEAHVLKPEYRELFTQEEIDTCKRRLKAVDYNINKISSHL